MAANPFFLFFVRLNEPILKKYIKKLLKFNQGNLNLRKLLIERAKENEIKMEFPKNDEEEIGMEKRVNKSISEIFKNSFQNKESVLENNNNSSTIEISENDFRKFFFILPKLIQNPLSCSYSYDENIREFKKIPPWKEYHYLNFDMKKINISSIINEYNNEQKDALKLIFNQDIKDNFEITCFSYSDNIFNWIKSHSSLTYGYIKSSLNFFNNLEKIEKVKLFYYS